MAMLRRGLSGEPVRILQERLGLTADGIFDPNTETTVREFQNNNNLQINNVLMQLNKLHITNNNTIHYHDRFRCQFDAVVGDYHIGDHIAARILRAGKVHAVSMRMESMAWLVPRTEFDRRPMWFLYGGLVFQRLTAEFLRIWGEHWWDKAPKELLHLFYAGNRKPERQEVVVLAQVLADAVNVGYEPFHNDVVEQINGHAPVDMADFVRRMDQATGEVVLQLSSGAKVLLDAAAARAAMPRILSRYHVPGDRSADLPQASVSPRRTTKARKGK